MIERIHRFADHRWNALIDGRTAKSLHCFCITCHGSKDDVVIFMFD